MRQKESKEGSKGGLEEKYNQIIIQKIKIALLPDKRNDYSTAERHAIILCYAQNDVFLQMIWNLER